MLHAQVTFFRVGVKAVLPNSISPNVYIQNSARSKPEALLAEKCNNAKTAILRSTWIIRTYFLKVLTSTFHLVAFFSKMLHTCGFSTT